MCQYHTLLWYWYLSSKSFWCNYIDLNALFPVLPHSFWSTRNPCHARVAPKVLLLKWLSFLVTSWNQCKKVPNWIRSSPWQWSLTTWTTPQCFSLPVKEIWHFPPPIMRHIAQVWYWECRKTIGKKIGCKRFLKNPFFWWLEGGGVSETWNFLPVPM